jgi:hypothetical protein
MQTSKQTAAVLGVAPDAEPDRAYSIEEAAERATVCARTLRNDAAAGKLELKKLRRRTIVTATELARYLKDLPSASAAA